MVKPRSIIPKESVGRMIKSQGAELVSGDSREAAAAYAEQRIKEITVFALDQLKVGDKKKIMKEHVIFAIKKSCAGIGADWQTASLMPPNATLTVGAVRRVMDMAGAKLVAEDAVFAMINYIEFELKEIVTDAIMITKHEDKKKITASTFQLAKNMRLAKRK